MRAKRVWLGSGLLASLLGVAGLISTLPVAAQTSNKPPSTTTMAPGKKAGDDTLAEFARLDKNNDGFLDKKEAMMEPRLLTKFSDADTNKDGKIDKAEFTAFEAAQHASNK